MPLTFSIVRNKSPGSMQAICAHYRHASETPFEWRFAGGPIVARDCRLTVRTLNNDNDTNNALNYTVNMCSDSKHFLLK